VITIDDILPEKHAVTWEGQKFWTSHLASISYGYCLQNLPEGEQVHKEVLTPEVYPSEHPKGAVVLYIGTGAGRRVAACLPYEYRVFPAWDLQRFLWPS
jgi:hypothetical protein